MMDQSIKARWVAKLREPGRRQTQGKLQDASGAQCCLGVLCEIAVEDGVIQPPLLFESKGEYGYRDNGGCYEFGILPDVVAAWSGLVDECYIKVDGELIPAVMLNDDWGWDFLQIADAIEADEEL